MDTYVNRLGLLKNATLNKSDKTFIAVQRRLSNPDATKPDASPSGRVLLGTVFFNVILYH